jgi:maltooligosyltrehalose trehalohydrolase
MGEEYGETAPFLYFTDHSDAALAKAVRDGRRSEFAGFHGEDEVPDPQAETTFLNSKLDHTLSQRGTHKILLEFYRELLRLRKAHAAFANVDAAIDSSNIGDCLSVRIAEKAHEFILLLNFSERPAGCAFPRSGGSWSKVVDSAEERWGGAGSNMPSLIAQDSNRNLELAPTSFCGFENQGLAQEGQHPQVGEP